MTCCNYRRGEEWYKVRRILNMKMLKPKVIGEYAQGLNEVSSDLLSQLKKTRDGEGLIPNIQDELFKWSLECESGKPFILKRSCVLSRYSNLCKFYSIISASGAWFSLTIGNIGI